MPDQALYGDVHVYGKAFADTPAGNPNDLVRLKELLVYLAQAKDRANHTNTQPASTISDLDAVISAAIRKVVGAAPEALDTLEEIARQLASDETAAGALTTRTTNLEGRASALEAKANAHFEGTFGDGQASTLTIPHNLNNLDVRVEVLDLSLGRQTVFPVVSRPDANSVRLDFGTYKPAANTVRVLVDARP